MDSFTLYRERIGESLTRRLADAIAQEIVTIDEAAEISQAILEKIDTVKDHQELMDFVEELARKWTLFGPILVGEQSQKIAQEEDAAVDQVSTLLKENKLDEAVAAAEQATQDSQESSSLPELYVEDVSNEEEAVFIPLDTPQPTDIQAAEINQPIMNGGAT